MRLRFQQFDRAAGIAARGVLLAVAVLWAAAGPAAGQPTAAAAGRTAPDSTGGLAPAGQEACAQGRALYRQGRFAEARQALRECLDQSGESVEVLLPLAVMAIREGRPAEGVEYAARAAVLAPQDAEARYWHGRALLEAGRKQEARAEWEAGLQVQMTHQGILEGLARLAIQDGQTAQAYNLLNQIRQQGTDEVWLHRLLADLAAGKGQWTLSLQHFQDAMAKEGPNPTDLMSCSELSILAGDNAHAVDFCRRAVALAPGPDTYGGLGEAFFADQQMDSALVYLRLAVAQPGAKPRFLFNLANALEVSELYDEAEVHFQAFLKQSPEDAVGRFNYGIHLDRLGRKAAGREQIRQAIALDPAMLSARVVLAQMCENAGDLAGALEQVRQLQRRDTENAAELRLWEKRLVDQEAQAQAARGAGKVRLLHMVLGSQAVLDLVQTDLRGGGDFSSLAERYSTGPGAVKGGDIGWIDPADMVEPLQSAIRALAPGVVSPPVAAKGLFHLFKRVQ